MPTFGGRQAWHRGASACPVALAVVLALLVLLGVPRPALADDEYSITKVDMDATVGADGSLAVSETRTFDFDGDFHGVYWDIPKGTYDGQEVACAVGSAGETSGGSVTQFQLANEGDPNYRQDGTYSVSSSSDYDEVTLYSAHSDESVTFTVTYTLSNLARRYADTSELYWKFVGERWEVDSDDVTCTIHLPVPAGQSVTAGKNVRAWGHGPLDANVSFDGNDVIYKVPEALSGDYAEARAVFPAEWLSGVQPSSEKRLDSILSEEKKWADEANARRSRARLTIAAVTIGGIALGIFSIVMIIRKRKEYRLSHTPQFDDKYFRDVPTDDHPAVLGALYKDGEPDTRDLTASIMHLADLGVLKLDVVRRKKKRFLSGEETIEDYCISIAPKADWKCPEKELDEVDRATIKFVRVVSRLAGKLGEHHGEKDTGVERLEFSDLERVAKGFASSYDDAWSDWRGIVLGSLSKSGYMTDKRNGGKSFLFGVEIADFAFVVLVGVILYYDIMGTGMALVWVFLACAFLVVVGLVARHARKKMRDLSPKAIEVNAKLKALRNWLCDFTRLEEAVPQDVVLWNRLLVIAVDLDVAKEVIDQLKVAAPQVIDDLSDQPVYFWYYGNLAMGSPSDCLGKATSDAHSACLSKLSESSMSSSGGSGGGFSGGGGGGFGGGGGGGAF